MPSLRYQMPDNLAEIAKKNLAQADMGVSKFNDTARTFSRQPYATTATNTAPAPAASSFKFTSIGGPVDTSLGNPVNSFKQPSVSATTSPPDSTNWRFRSFGASQLNGNGGGTALDKLAAATNPAAYGQQVSPVVTPSNPSGVGTSPVVPPNYQPRDMSKEQAQYGWGGG